MSGIYGPDNDDGSLPPSKSMGLYGVALAAAFATILWIIFL